MFRELIAQREHDARRARRVAGFALGLLTLAIIASTF